MTQIKMNISYSQIAIFNSNMESPFNNWSNDHVDQGFSWREKSVSFKTLIDDGEIDVYFSVADALYARPDSLRTISVPLTCDEQGSLEIGTITEGVVEQVSAGSYQIVFETGFDGADAWCRFTAIPNGNAEPRILVLDPALNPPDPLLMEATSA